MGWMSERISLRPVAGEFFSLTFPLIEQCYSSEASRPEFWRMTPSTHKRRLFSRFALGMIGMHDSTGITASFHQTKTPLNALSNSCATPALCFPDRGLVYASESLNLACTRDFAYRTGMERELPLMTGDALPKNEVRITRRMSRRVHQASGFNPGLSRPRTAASLGLRLR